MGSRQKIANGVRKLAERCVGLELGAQEDITTQVQAEESWILINIKYNAHFAT